jgi:hypothetical protein
MSNLNDLKTMANFSVNQVHQLYVVSGYNASVTDASAVGTIGAVQAIDDILGKQVMFKVKGVENVLHSDLIQIGNIGYAKAVPASDMVTVMKKVEITLDSTVNGGAPVSGQDYVLSINFRNFFSSGDASQYYKDAAVHATANMTASAFYTAMVASLNAAFGRENGATKTSNPYLKFSTKAKGGEGDDRDDAVAIVIEEKPQEWALGTKKARRIMFDVFCSTIYTGGDDLVWGVVTDATPARSAAVVGTNAVGNGQQIADLEWFCMGERGDQYRNVGWPHVIPTKYLVDPTQQYHVLELHYAFTDSGVNSYRTEKEITVVAPATSAGKTALNGFIGALNTATGLSIATLA